MPTLIHARRFDIQTNSVALPPSGAFVAYTEKRGVVIDDGRRRLFRRSARNIFKSDTAYVIAATDEGVVFTDRKHLSFVSLTGEVAQLLPTDRHIPVDVHFASQTLTTVLGQRVVQFDTSTWTQRRSIDVGQDLDMPGYTWCSYDGQTIALGTQARFVILDEHGELDVVHPAARRYRPRVLHGRLICERAPDTVVSDFLTDEELEVWPDESHSAWCSTANETRAVSGPDVVIRAPDGGVTRYIAEPTADPMPRTDYVRFADEAPRVARWFLHSRHFDVFEWS